MPDNLFDLTGKVALIAGGTRGIGFGMAQALARSGADVVVWGTDAARAAEAAKALQAFGVRALGQGVDVADEQAVDTAMLAAADTMGRIDMVVANAAAPRGTAPFAEFPTDLYRRTLAVGLDGAFYTLRAACRHMVQRAKAGDPGGSVVGVSSLVALTGGAGNEAYGACKAAMLAMTRSIASEYARYGIRGNAIIPGWIDTERTAALRANPSVEEKVTPRIPMRRWGRPDDFGGIAVYLASDLSAYHTGDMFIIDGGYAVF
ncbi:MAG: family oxidoreductase [Caulobacter sp.]|nr:family oxidoreductase [Caulobacter sp.]